MDAVAQMWADYLTHRGLAGPVPEVFGFGDSAAMADELGDLVRHGPKRATAGLLADYLAENEPLPRVGDHAVVTGGDPGIPLAVIATTEVRVAPMSSVDDAFAWDEGEGDRSRDFWLAAHTDFFTRRCADLGLRFDPVLDVVFVRFEVVWPVG